jgi:hypothetical protein
MECAQSVCLRKNYTKACAIFDAAKARLEQRIGICPKSEFLALSGELDRALAELERTRVELDAHIWEHCCTVRGSSTVTQD